MHLLSNHGEMFYNVIIEYIILPEKKLLCCPLLRVGKYMIPNIDESHNVGTPGPGMHANVMCDSSILKIICFPTQSRGQHYTFFPLV